MKESSESALYAIVQTSAARRGPAGGSIGAGAWVVVSPSGATHERVRRRHSSRQAVRATATILGVPKLACGPYFNTLYQ
jgi:hypothetical protein